MTGVQTCALPICVPITDAATGLVSREWYRFFLSLFDLVGGGTNSTSIGDLLVAPQALNMIDEIGSRLQDLQVDPRVPELLDEIRKEIDALKAAPPSTLAAEIAQLKNDISLASTSPVYVPSAVTKPYFEGLNTSATITLPTTATVFVIPTVMSNSGFIYNNTTGVIQFTQAGNYALEIMVNAQPSSANKNMYFYGEVNLGSGWTPVRYSGRTIPLLNIGQQQFNITSVNYWPVGAQVRIYLWGDATITLKTADVDSTPSGTVTMPAIRLLLG